MNQLSAATKRGNLDWEVDPSDEQVYQAQLGNGSVRLYRLVSFSAEWPRGPIGLELLDPKGRGVFEYQQQTPNYPAINDLYEMARRKALRLDRVITAILDDIKRLAEK